MLCRLLIAGPPHRGIPTRLKRAVYRAVVLGSPATVDVSFPQPPVEVIEWEAKDVVEFPGQPKESVVPTHAVRKGGVFGDVSLHQGSPAVADRLGSLGPHDRPFD